MEGNRYYIEDVNGVPGIFRQAPPVRIQGAEKVLEAMAMNMGCAIQAAFKCGDRVVRLNCKQGYTVMSCPIVSLNLKTTFHVNASGFLVPMFETNPDYLQLDLKWPVPPQLKLYLAVKAIPNQWRPERACLFVRVEGQTGNWRLPIANTYSDGRICLGRQYEQIRKTSMQEVMQESLNLLDTASWNSDLFEDGWRIANCHAMFAFKTADRTPVYHANPGSLCTRVNNTVIEEAL